MTTLDTSAAAASSAPSNLPAAARKAAPGLLVSQDWRNAMVATKGGRWAEALRLMTKSARTYSRDPWLALNMARTHVELGQKEKAIDWARVTLTVCPGDQLALDLLLHCLTACRRFEEAVTLVDTHVAEGDRNADLYADLAYQQILVGDRGASIRNLMKGLSIQMDHARSHFLMGVAFMASARHAEALECFQTAIILGAGRDQLAAEAHCVYLARQELNWEVADPALVALNERLRGMRDDERVWSAVFASATLLSDPQLQLKAARSSAEQLAERNKPLGAVSMLPGLTGRRRPLRVGFVSADFHHHATAFLLMEVFEHLSGECVDVFLYSHGPDDGSAERKRLMAAATKFIDIADEGDLEAARLIQADKIDVLIDLKGHTSGSRLQLFSYRPAPVQATFLGHPGTTGASYIDYFIGDAIVTPEGHQAHYSETLAHMPHCYQPNDRQRPLPKSMTRAEAGLPESGLVYCGFNQPYKISSEVFDVWCDLLHQQPESVLWLLDWFDGTVNKFRVHAVKRGIAPERLISAPKLRLDQHITRFALADVFLDTWPCNGHTTASDALWAGVPVVTLSGETFASRVAASLLTAVDLPELITTSADDYKVLVMELAHNPSKRRLLRDHLAQARCIAPLFDSAKFAADFSKLLWRMAEGDSVGRALQKVED